MMLAETAHGAWREVFLAPRMGALHARQIGVPVGCALVFIIAWLTARWVHAATRREQVIVGASWVALTVTFELALGLATGSSWPRMLADYDPARGGLMLAGLAFMFFTPQLVRGRLR